MCLAQGHNTVTPVRLEPAASRSRVKHSTTESLRSLNGLTYALGSIILYHELVHLLVDNQNGSID